MITYQNEIPYEVEVLVTADDILHEVKAKLNIEFTAEQWDEYGDGWDINYDIAFEKVEMRNVETDEPITLVDDALASVLRFVENYVRNGAGGLNHADVIQKCGELASEEFKYGYQEEH